MNCAAAALQRTHKAQQDHAPPVAHVRSATRIDSGTLITPNTSRLTDTPNTDTPNTRLTHDAKYRATHKAQRTEYMRTYMAQRRAKV